MSIEILIDTWKDVRNGFIDEVNNVPADKFDFCATPDTRSVADLVQHVIQTQKVLVGELCRADSNFQITRFPEMIQKYAGGVSAVKEKDELLKLLKESMTEAESTIRSFGEKGLNEMTTRLDKQITKMSFLQFSVSHEMYHRGQFTVYERLLKIEPVLTSRIKKMMSAAS